MASRSMKDFVAKISSCPAPAGFARDGARPLGLSTAWQCKQTAEALHSALADLDWLQHLQHLQSLLVPCGRGIRSPRWVKFFGEPADHSRMGLLELPNPLRLYSQSGPIVDSILLPQAGS